jgi:ArsR family transcriptional regulator
MNLSAVFRVLGNPTRLRIYHLICRRPGLAVAKIVAITGLQQPLVSRYLAHLQAAGLVVLKRDGRWVRCTATPAGLAAVRAFLRAPAARRKVS